MGTRDDTILIQKAFLYDTITMGMRPDCINTITRIKKKVLLFPECSV